MSPYPSNCFFSSLQLSVWTQSKKLCLVCCQIFDKVSQCPDRPWTHGQIPPLIKGISLHEPDLLCVFMCVRTASSEGLNQAKSGEVNPVYSHQNCSLISSCLPLLFKFSCSAFETSSASEVCLQPASYYALCFYYQSLSESVTNRFHLQRPF